MQQAKLDQALNQNQRGSFMGMIEVIPRTAGVDGSTVRRQHNVIHVALSRTKNPAHGKGASDIRRIVLQLTAGIDQHQVPFGQIRVVLHIVQGTNVFTGSYNG